MPYYCWRGVTLDASWCKGTLFARNQEVLRQRLLQQEIALVRCAKKKDLNLLPISFEQKLLFFQHFYALLSAGIHIWQALNIISEQTSDARFAEIIDSISSQVEQGNMLHKAFEQHANIFLPEMIHVIDIGIEADNLPVALNMLCHHLQEAHEFKKKLRSALLLPIVTFGIFLVIMLVILFFIVPKYAQLFASMSKELPSTTRMLMTLSAFISSYYMVGTLFIFVTVCMVLLQVSKRTSIKKKIDEHLLVVPHVGILFKQIDLVYFLRSLSLLLEGGLPLVPALSIAKEAVYNSFFKASIQDMITEVEAGQELSAVMQQRSKFFAQDIILLITVGQETGHLLDMVHRASELYQQKVQRTLNRYTMMIQPALMIILGLLVAGLIFAVYTPLFNLADVV
ncbi:MAG: type II secretion system F family protein [Candidatus Dependentiae bacterium]